MKRYVRGNKKNNKKSWLKRCIAFAAIMFALLLLCGKISTYISPDNLGVSIVFHLLFPLLWFINLLFFIWGLFRFKMVSLYVGVALLASFSVFSAHMQWFNSPSNNTVYDNNSISVLSFNLRSFKVKGQSRQLQIKENVIKYIGEQHPDLLCLQESVSYKNLNTIKQFQDSLQMPYVATYRYNFADRKLSYEDLMCLFSKYPIIDHEPFYQNSKLYALRADILIDSVTYSVYNVHLASNHFGKEQYQLFSDAQVKDKRNKFKRLFQRLKSSGQTRARQVRTLVHSFENNKHPIIICGDFNDTPASYSYQALSKHKIDAFREKGQGYGNTYNGPLPAMRIDYILADEELFEVIDYHVDKLNLSDHYPIKTKMVLLK